MNPAYKPFFGASSAFKESFPDVEEVRLTVLQDPNEHYCIHDWQRENLYTKATLPTLFRCVNARCQEGGIAVEDLILLYGNGDHDLPCRGHEGKAAGQAESDLCDNRFRITLVVQRSSE
jgi:hypothetical protein